MTVPGIYRVLLGLLPRAFRRRYGAEMAAMFEETWRSEDGRGRWRLVRRAIRDLVVSAVLLRVHPEEVERSRPGGARRGRIDGPDDGRRTMGRGVTRDLRYAMRSLGARPGFALTAILTVALGVGASSAVFSVIDAVVFRALPYEDAGRLVSVWTEFENMGEGRFGLSDAEFIDLRAEDAGFEELGVYALGEDTWLPTGGEPTRISTAYLSPSLLRVLGVRTHLGRLPGERDVVPDGSGQALLQHDFWTRAFGADPSVVGRTLDLDGSAVEVAGILEPGTRLPDGDPSAWIVYRRDRGAIVDRSGHYLSGVGRLSKGVEPAAVRQEIEAVHARWREEYAGVHSPGHAGHAFALAPLDEVVVGGARRVGWILAGGAGLLLLLACVNVAGLLVARGESRLGEMGVRTALGAGRGALTRQLLVESLALAVAGGLAGYGLAAWGTGAILSVDPSSLGGLERVRPDVRTLGFALAAAVTTGLAFGLLPVLRIPRNGASALLGRGGRGRIGTGEGPVLRGLVVGQVAIATTVVVVAGLLLRSRAELTSVDPGFEAERAFAFELSLPAERVPDAAAAHAFWNDLALRLEGLPGVEEAGVIRNLPLRSESRRENIVPGGWRDGLTPDDLAPVVVQAVGPGALEALGVAILEGRAIEGSDREDTRPVALVNAAAARAIWSDGAVGERFAATFAPRGHGDVTVVGVVEDVRHTGLDDPAEATVYLPVGQVPNAAGWVRSGSVVLRASAADGVLLPAVRRIVREVAPTVPVESFASLEEVVRGAAARMRFLSLVLGVFAGAALLVAAVGVYGTVSFGVARRRRELGVRLALGARPGGVLARVLGSGLRMAVVGAGLGLGAALLLTPAVPPEMLFRVGARDPAVLVTGPVILLAVVLLACWLPARRAARVAPAESLRAEG